MQTRPLPLRPLLLAAALACAAIPAQADAPAPDLEASARPEIERGAAPSRADGQAARPAPAAAPQQEPAPAPVPAQEGEPAGEQPTPPPAAGGAAPSGDAFRMGSPAALPQGMAEEEMWPAADAEGWKKPVLVRWQRSFDDALRVARAEQRPILVAVNMDGEIASEHYAGVRYREPETATMMSAYACVIASVYRHTPRDYDEEGERVECPRFGTVTCGEHVEAERELYGRYFDGVRVAPRHIVLDLEERETHDVYYSWDTATVFTTFRKGVEGWPDPIEPSEPTVEDRLRSADVEDREFVERTFAEGDRETRRALLLALLEERVVDQVELLRQAIFGLDLELARLARQALAECETEGALDLIAEALKTPLEASERQMLLDAVARLAERSTRARTLAALHSGLSLGSRHIDPGTTGALAREYEANAARATDVQAHADAAEARPEDPAALLELAEALVARAHAEPRSRFASLWLEDARQAAAEAEGLGAAGPRLDAVAAVTAAELGDLRTARARAVAAVEGGIFGARAGEALDAGGEGGTASSSASSRALLLRLFAEARERAIRAAYRADGDWPPEWLSDVNAAYASLLAGELVDDRALADYHDFLRWVGAAPRADQILDEALRRFPDSPLLHSRLRDRLVWEGGPEALERAYAERLGREAEAAEPTQITWFAGYASLVAAEHHRRRGELDQALAAYGRGIERYQRNVELFPDGREQSELFIALAHAGRARVLLEERQLTAATEALVAGLTLHPDSAATPDGLHITPIQTARMLQSRLTAEGDAPAAARVRAALDALDPRLLEPPPSERPVLGGGDLRGRGGRPDRIPPRDRSQGGG